MQPAPFPFNRSVPNGLVDQKPNHLPLKTCNLPADRPPYSLQLSALRVRLLFTTYEPEDHLDLTTRGTFIPVLLNWIARY